MRQQPPAGLDVAVIVEKPDQGDPRAGDGQSVHQRPGDDAGRSHDQHAHVEGDHEGDPATARRGRLVGAPLIGHVDHIAGQRITAQGAGQEPGKREDQAKQPPRSSHWVHQKNINPEQGRTAQALQAPTSTSRRMKRCGS
ncbi:hypothetical protein D9M70_565380 [compost metagenome]